jgi:hypothetical protein
MGPIDEEHDHIDRGGTTSPDDPAAPAPSRHRTLLLGGVLAALAVTAAAAALLVTRSDSRSPVATVAADFSRPRVTLAGAPFAGSSWSVVAGRFEVREGAVSAIRAGPSPGLATVALAEAPTQLSVVFAEAASTSGIVFRYADQANYWSVTAAHEFGTWNINKTVRGRTSFVANTGNNFSATNTSLQIRLVGTRITLSVDGTPSMRVDDDALLGATGVGLLCGTGDDGRTRWVSFMVSGA